MTSSIRIQTPQRPDFFSSLIFTTAQEVFITVKIVLIFFFSCMDEYYVLNTYVLDFTSGYRVQNQRCGVMVISYNLTRGSSSFQCCHMIVNEPIEIIH